MENNFWRDRIIQHDMMQKYLAGHTNYSKKPIFIGYFEKLFDQSRIFIWQTKSAPSQMQSVDRECQADDGDQKDRRIKKYRMHGIGLD
jgi:hypothetical protein